MTRIARRYARALFSITGSDLAKAKKERDSLIALKELFDAQESGRVLRSPVMPMDLKQKILDYGMNTVGASDEVKKLVSTVVQSGRVATLPDVADAFSTFIDEAEGRVRAEVTSSVALKPEDMSEIAASLGRVLHKKVDMTNEVDTSLLGGFLVRVGNYRIDMSLKTRLDDLAASAVQDSLR